MNRVEAASGQISSTFYDWLKAEVDSSGIERNKILDNYDGAVEGLRGGWNHPKNFIARKVESHLARLPLWFEAFSLDPSDDYQAARLVLAGLMQVSGSYRSQCYVEAQSKEDYLHRRKKAVGYEISQTIHEHLRTHLPSTGNFAKADISLDSLNEDRIEVERVGLQAVRALCARTQYGYDLGQEGSRSAREMLDAQHHWLNFATGCLTLVAKERDGNLAAVPFLEPRSITDQSGKLYYALASPVDWEQALAI